MSYRIISKAVYFCGVLMVMFLGLISLFGSKSPIFPEAMIAYSWRESAFIWLAFGSVPMLIACAAARRQFGGSRKKHAIIFLPGLISGGCGMYIFGLIAVMYVQGVMLR